VGGIVAIAFWSMVLVVASGVFGRYLYVRIPKTLHGAFLTREAMERRREEVLASMGTWGALDGAVLARVRDRIRPDEPRNLPQALLLGLQWDLGRARRKKEILALMEEPGGSRELTREVVTLALEEARLGMQTALLQPFQRLFRYWHVFHLPLAIVMFLILTVHVTVAILFGYAWVL
jgi:hypothetical protein